MKDTSERFEIDPDKPFENARKYGSLWGPGETGQDTTLYRVSAHLLMTEEALRNYAPWWVDEYVAGRISIEELECELHRIIVEQK